MRGFTLCRRNNRRKVRERRWIQFGAREFQVGESWKCSLSSEGIHVVLGCWDHRPRELDFIYNIQVQSNHPGVKGQHPEKAKLWTHLWGEEEEEELKIRHTKLGYLTSKRSWIRDTWPPPPNLPFFSQGPISLVYTQKNGKDRINIHEVRKVGFGYMMNYLEMPQLEAWQKMGRKPMTLLCSPKKKGV